MARVYKEGNWWNVDYVDEHGRRRRAKAAHTKLLAQQELAKRLKEVSEAHLGLNRVKARLTFRAFSRPYLHYARVNKRSWQRDEITIEKHLDPVFGHLLLTEITSERIERYKSQRAKKVAKSTVNRELDCVKKMFSLAVEWDYLVKSPSACVKKFKVDNRRLVFLERDEIDSLLEACSAHFRPICEAFVLTGMRRDELRLLRWQDVDLKRGLINLVNTKNGESRSIPTNSRLRKTMSRIPRRLRSPYVFTRKDGQPWKDFRDSLRGAVRRSGLSKHVTTHTLRHTFASHLVMAGVDIVTVSELLGHKSVEMTRRRYVHLSPDHKKSAMESLERHLKKPQVSSHEKGE